MRTGPATRLRELLASRIVVLDGAIGTMLQRHRLSEEDFRGERFRDHARPGQGGNDVLGRTRPDVVEGVHTADLEAGEDVMTTDWPAGAAGSHAGCRGRARGQ